MKQSIASFCLFALILSVLIVFTLAVPQPVLAEWPPAGDDIFGLYFWDYDAGEYQPFYMLGIGVAHVSFILTNVTAASVGGFECSLSFSEADVIITIDEGLPPGSTQWAWAPNDYIVGFNSPRPIISGYAILCEPVYLVITFDPVYVTAGPSPIESIPGAMAYVEYFEYGALHEMYPASGSFDEPLFAFNDDEVVASESLSWTDLKSLYR